MLIQLLIFVTAFDYYIQAQSVSYERGVDVSELVTTDQFKCMYAAGYRLAIVRVYRGHGAVGGTPDPNALQTMINAVNGILLSLLIMLVLFCYLSESIYRSVSFSEYEQNRQCTV
jgi:hypothetical protein